MGMKKRAKTYESKNKQKNSENICDSYFIKHIVNYGVYSLQSLYEVNVCTSKALKEQKIHSYSPMSK